MMRPDKGKPVVRRGRKARGLGNRDGPATEGVKVHVEQVLARARGCEGPFVRIQRRSCKPPEGDGSGPPIRVRVVLNALLAASMVVGIGVHGLAATLPDSDSISFEVSRPSIEVQAADQSSASDRSLVAPGQPARTHLDVTNRGAQRFVSVTLSTVHPDAGELTARAWLTIERCSIAWIRRGCPGRAQAVLGSGPLRRVKARLTNLDLASEETAHLRASIDLAESASPTLQGSSGEIAYRFIVSSRA